MIKFKRTTLSLVTGLLASGLTVQDLYAQNVGSQSGAELEEVVVTGSRIRSGTTTTPVPVTAISSEDLLSATPGNLADGLKQLPALSPGGGPTAGGGTRSGGQQFLNLRGLGSDRNLILLNGRRMVMADPLNRVDVNLIPQSLVSRVDVVTGGASAAYGSDAVAGVVNFILNTNYEGFRLDAYQGISERGDNYEYKISPTFGFRALDGRLHVIGSADHVDNEGLSGSARSFRRTAPNQIQDPQNRSMLIRADDLRTPFTDGGLVVTGVGGNSASNALFQGLMFTDNGVANYDYGRNSTTIGAASGSQDGGDGYTVSVGQEIVRPLRRTNVYVSADYELTHSTSLFGEVVYADTLSAYEASPSRHTFNISADNPFLMDAAPDIVAQMDEVGVTDLRINRMIPELGRTVSKNSNETTRYLMGLRGDTDRWNWDAAVQYGQNDNRSPTYANMIMANTDRALDAMLSPQGDIVCADTLSEDPDVAAAAAGCVPLNPFGPGSPSAASLAYIDGVSVFETINKQTAAEANISGPLFNMPSGDEVFAAVGAEWRKISARTTVDDGSRDAIYRLINTQPFAAEYSVKEVYTELQIPVLKDRTLVEALDLNLAARLTDYSTSGAVTTWKASVSWQMTNDLRLRSTVSEDIRAPSLEELFASGRQNNITIVDELTGQTFLQVPNRTFGNANLDPEEATTKVIGFVYQPSWLEGFDVAIDYYNVKIEKALQNLGGNRAVDLCNISNQESTACDLVVRDPSTMAIVGTFTSPINLATQTVSGVDIETAYRMSLNNNFGGDLTFRFVGGYVDKNILESPLIPFPTNIIGSARESSQPHFRGNLSARYERDALSLFTQARYIGAFTWDKRMTLGVDTDFNYVPSQVYVDAEARYRFDFGNHELQAYLNISNLLDKGMVYSPSTGGSTPLPTDTGLYDQIGRMYRVGIRYMF